MVDREAFSRAFNLLAHVFESGFTQDVRARLHQAGDPITCLVDYDESEARHQEILGFAVLPYAGVYLNSDARIGGDTEAVLVRARLDAGLGLSNDSLPPEHVASESRLIASLVSAPACDEISSRVIADHMLSWLPVFTHALRENGSEDYAEAGDLVIELCVAFLEGMGETTVHPYLPPVEVPTEKQGAGIREIAEHLTVHARTGMYLGRAGIGRIARQAKAPRGFGGSALMMGNLLRSAANFDSLGEVTQSLEATATSFEIMWQGRSSRHSAIRCWSELWQERAQATLAMLGQITGAVEAEARSAIETQDEGAGAKS